MRLRALEILNERMASPSDIAREIGLPVANVSYHVNTLLRLKCIEEVEHRHVRGAIEHLYRAVRRPFAELGDVARMPANVRASLLAEVFTSSMTDARAALIAGTAEKRSDLYWSYTKGEVDGEAFRNIHKILREAYIAIEAQQQAAKERIAEGAESIPWRLSMLHYEAPGADA